MIVDVSRDHRISFDVERLQSRPPVLHLSVEVVDALPQGLDADVQLVQDVQSSGESVRPQGHLHQVGVSLGPEVEVDPVRKVPDQSQVEFGAGFSDLHVRVDQGFHQVDGLVPGVVGGVAVV